MPMPEPGRNQVDGPEVIKTIETIDAVEQLASATGLEPEAVETAVTHYQIVLRPYTDIRNPAPGFITALAGQFSRAVDQTQGRVCLTVPHSVFGDDTRDVAETLLHAAAARSEFTTKTWLRIEVTGARYTDDGACHVFADCKTRAPITMPRIGDAGAAVEN